MMKCTEEVVKFAIKNGGFIVIGCCRQGTDPINNDYSNVGMTKTSQSRGDILLYCSENFQQIIKCCQMRTLFDD